MAPQKAKPFLVLFILFSDQQIPQGNGNFQRYPKHKRLDHYWECLGMDKVTTCAEISDSHPSQSQRWICRFVRNQCGSGDDCEVAAGSLSWTAASHTLLLSKRSQNRLFWIRTSSWHSSSTQELTLQHQRDPLQDPCNKLPSLRLGSHLHWNPCSVGKHPSDCLIFVLQLEMEASSFTKFPIAASKSPSMMHPEKAPEISILPWDGFLLLSLSLPLTLKFPIRIFMVPL